MLYLQQFAIQGLAPLLLHGLPPTLAAHSLPPRGCAMVRHLPTSGKGYRVDFEKFGYRCD